MKGSLSDLRNTGARGLTINHSHIHDAVAQKSSFKPSVICWNTSFRHKVQGDKIDNRNAKDSAYLLS